MDTNDDLGGGGLRLVSLQKRAKNYAQRLMATCRGPNFAKKINMAIGRIILRLQKGPTKKISTVRVVWP
jgi:hypothetical protein